MNEQDFTDELRERLDRALAPHIQPCLVRTRKSLTYDLTISDEGAIREGIDTDSGETIRGGGMGFEQDLLIYEPSQSRGQRLVPRIAAEVKFRHVTTHDAIVYSEKARRIRAVYPYIRYGLILGAIQKIPGRVVRLGQGFDFVFAMSYPLIPRQIKACCIAFLEELQVSRDLARIAFKSPALTSFRRKIVHDMTEDAGCAR